MAVGTAPAAPVSAGPSPPPRDALRRPEVLAAGGVAVAGLILAVVTHAVHLEAIPGIARGAVASVVLFLACGDALAFALVPRSWGVLAKLMSLPLGAASSALALTALGFAQVPLQVSLWLVLAAGIGASVVTRRRARGGGGGDGAGGEHGEATRASSSASREDRTLLACWVGVLFVVALIALIPAWRTGADTIYGENPDAHQVAGIAVLFQHAPPTATDVSLPIDTVPPSWRFRYPIFYALAGASNLSHYDPIRVFPAMAALLIVISALGFAVLAVRYLGLPPAGGLLTAGAFGIWPVALHLGWHPYWNQLWGLALLPYAVLFGVRAMEARDRRAAALLVLMLVTLWLAYPLAAPYPLVVLAGVVIAYWRRPKLPRVARARTWVGIVVAALVLLPALAGAAVKLGQGVSQLLSAHSSLWSGDIVHLLPVGFFAGTGGGVVPAVAVLIVAASGLRLLAPRARVAVGVVLALLCLLDLRFRLTSGGAYMDFKHLSFVGSMVLLLAAGSVCALLFSGAGREPGSRREPGRALRSRPALLAGVALGLSWTGAAIAQDRSEGYSIPQQVPSVIFQIRDWAAKLPPGASVRVDIPPSGTQLWAVYMLGDHPVDSPMPILGTTYAHAHYGLRADYSLGYRHAGGGFAGSPAALPPFTAGPPVFEDSQFVVRRIVWPASLASYPKTASTRLVEP